MDEGGEVGMKKGDSREGRNRGEQVTEWEQQEEVWWARDREQREQDRMLVHQ